ncbi:uncharacterized protein LOC116522194 isoform X2 [Thamnophis elegans]|uniref:uncharacterized protein LOC116522194 isoform X2 n=1 Tax=Thamnophis elegans TaxID=35005 RepID=UPI001377375A|nr:uncharacterized protein LOC116522194 isoform X2 [Thamnophis elegans]
MADNNRKFILEILEDLSLTQMGKLEFLLNDGQITKNRLENLDAKKAAELLMTTSYTPLKTLSWWLEQIPRIDLIQNISAKIEAGKYTLFDLEDYATKNQDQLIMHLENILEPAGFNALKKQLMSSVLKKFLPFTAQKYYDLFKNNELKEFLKNINGQSKKIPVKLLNVLFSQKKTNHKRKFKEPIQTEGKINLKKKQSIDDDDYDNMPDKAPLTIENENTPNHPLEHKPGNEDSDVIEGHWPDKDSRMAIEHKPGNEASDVIEGHWPDKDSRMAIEHKPGNEDSDVIEEHGLDKDSRMAIERWHEKKKNNYSERISFNYICSHEHQSYPCFIAENVLQFKLPDDPNYSILAIQDKKDFTNSQRLKKEVEFALQFNMAVLNVKSSEVISSNGFLCEIRANDSFAESVSFLKDIVVEIVLPVLALYKRIKLNAFENVLYPNNESKSSFSQKLQV